MNQKLLSLLFFLISLFSHSQSVIWKTNMNDAILLSNEERKPILIFFTAGSSKKIQSEVFSSPDFIDWSESVVLLKLDLADASVPDLEKEQNLRLKEALGIEELPQFCIATASVRKNKPTINKLGLFDYKTGGAKTWISQAKDVLRGE